MIAPRALRYSFVSVESKVKKAIWGYITTSKGQKNYWIHYFAPAD
jgi:hypothetical protein